MTDQSSGPVTVDVVAAEDRLRPRTWWQWVVLFPTLAMALITALPDWMDSALALMKGVSDAKNSELLERNRMFTRNLDCIGAPYQWYKVPSGDRIVDATLCPSGDLFVRVRVPDDTSPLATVVDGGRFRDRADFVSIDKIVERADRFAALDMLGLTAQAGTVPQQSVPVGPNARRSDHLVLVQDQFVFVICQKFVDERMLLRHLQVEGQCFDETVDTYTGVTISRNAVACRTSC
jgi:hypothetical protein